MQRRNLSTLIRFVLLTTAASAACGGLVEDGTRGETERGDDSDDAYGQGSCYASGCTSNQGWGASSSSSSGSSSGEMESSSGYSSSGYSTSSSGYSSSGTTTSSSSGTSGWGGCDTGVVEVTPDVCCADPEDCPNKMYGAQDADAGACVVDCKRVCDSVSATPSERGFNTCYFTGADSTTVSYACGACGVGRIAAGTDPHALGGTLGERLARQAYYESASVTAFARLARVLSAAAAPWDLVRRAQRAAEEEARHAATFAALASEHGATPCAPELDAADPTLFELALENATEGCVRETFGALLTLHQAEHAESAVVRAAFASIAEDEMQHAALSWDLFAWFETQLAPDQVAMMQDAYKIARSAAARDVIEAPDALGKAIGLPGVQRARAMFTDLMHGLDALREARAAA